MKKKDKHNSEDDMRTEYDYSQMKEGVQGKYATRFSEGTNIIRLEPDVAEVFMNDASVNEALRSLITIAKSQVKPAPH